MEGGREAVGGCASVSASRARVSLHVPVPGETCAKQVHCYGRACARNGLLSSPTELTRPACACARGRLHEAAAWRKPTCECKARQRARAGNWREGRAGGEGARHQEHAPLVLGVCVLVRGEGGRQKETEGDERGDFCVFSCQSVVADSSARARVWALICVFACMI